MVSSNRVLRFSDFGFVTPKMPKNLYVKFFRREIKKKTLTMKNSRRIRNRAWLSMLVIVNSRVSSSFNELTISRLRNDVSKGCWHYCKQIHLIHILQGQNKYLSEEKMSLSLKQFSNLKNLCLHKRSIPELLLPNCGFMKRCDFNHWNFFFNYW